MNDWLQCLKDCRDSIPFALYCTRLDTGAFEFVNNSFAALLRRPIEYFLDNNTTAESLYREAAQRDDWIELITAHPGFAVFVAEYLLGPHEPDLYDNSLHAIEPSRTTIRVIDIAKAFRDGEDEFVVGILNDYTEQWADEQALVNRVSAYRKILDRIDNGFHEFDQHRRIIFMNRYEKELLGLASPSGEGWLRAKPDVSELSDNRDGRDYETRQQRVDDKLKKGDENSLLTRGEHRSFVKPLTEKTPGEIVPVNIFDERIEEPDDHQEYRNREIFTVVLDESIPDDLRRLLRSYGPCNPLLEKVDGGVELATFIKIERQFALLEAKRRFVSDEIAPKLERAFEFNEKNKRDLVFTFGNSHFVKELVALTKRDPKIGVARQEDIWGRRERELWPNHAPRFARADREVLKDRQSNHGEVSTVRLDDDRWKLDERIEKHPSIDGGPDTDVQVLKLPLFYSKEEEVFTLNSASLDGKDYKAVGVAGFYWNVSNAAVSGIHEKIREKLSDLYRPWEILQNIPVPVLMKDEQKRFSYANDAYVRDLRSIRENLIRPIHSLYDIIGCTDQDIFSQTRANDYEKDDQSILDGKREKIEKREVHGHKNVRVIKTPLRRGGQIVGVQCIFWDEPESWRVRIKWGGEDEPSYLFIDAQSVEITRKAEWQLFDMMLQNHGNRVTLEDARSAGILARGASAEIEKTRKQWRGLKSKLCGGQGHGVLGEALSRVDTNLRFAIDPDDGGYKLTIDVSPTGNREIVSRADEK